MQNGLLSNIIDSGDNNEEKKTWVGIFKNVCGNVPCGNFVGGGGDLSDRSNGGVWLLGIPGGSFPDTFKFIEYCSKYGITTRISFLDVSKLMVLETFSFVHLRIINSLLSVNVKSFNVLTNGKLPKKTWINKSYHICQNNKTIKVSENTTECTLMNKLKLMW